MNKHITLRDIAGYCPEEAIWKMVIDLGQSIKDNGHCPLSPDGVMVDDKAFLTDDSADTQSQFLAPECTDGATKGHAGRPRLLCFIGANAVWRIWRRLSKESS